jgi:hypothetical protein
MRSCGYIAIAKVSVILMSAFDWRFYIDIINPLYMMYVAYSLMQDRRFEDVKAFCVHSRV